MSVEHAQQTPKPTIPNGQREIWVYLADWPLPPLGRERLAAELREYRYSSQQKGWLEEGLKLSCYFGGQWVVTMRISGRMVVLAAGPGGLRERVRFIDSLPREMQSQAVAHFVNDPNEPLPEVI